MNEFNISLSLIVINIILFKYHSGLANGSNPPKTKSSEKRNLFSIQRIIIILIITMIFKINDFLGHE